MAWGWVDGWKDAIVSTGGVIGNGFGALLDFGSHDTQGRKENWNQMLADVGKTIGGIEKGLGVLGPPIAWTLHKDYEIYSEWISQPISAIFTFEEVVTNDRMRDRFGHSDSILGDMAMWFDPKTYQKTWEIADHRSPGQSLVLMFTVGQDEKIEGQQVVEDAQRHWWFNLLSGTADATTLFFLDPLAIGAKAGRLGRVGKTTKDLDSTLAKMGVSREVIRGTPEAEQANEAFVRALQPDLPAGTTTIDELGPSPIARTLRWVDKQVKKSPTPLAASRTIEKHPILRGNANGGLIASMLADASPAERGLILRVAYGDGAAYHLLDETRPSIAVRLQTAYDVRKDLIEVQNVTRQLGLLTPAVKATFKARIKTAEKEIADNEARERWLDDLIGAHGTDNPGVRGALDQLPKRGLYPAIAEKSAEARGSVARLSQRAFNERVHFYNPFNSPVRVISAATGRLNHFFNGQRPTGWLDTNDPQGWRELDRTLAQTKGFDPSRREEFVTRYMRSTSEAEKLAIAKEAEEEAIRHAAARHGIPEDDAHGVLASAIQSYFWQRDQLRATVKNRAYSGAMENGQRIDFIDDVNAPTTIHPLTATQLANKIPLVDMQAVERAFGRSANILRAKGGKWLRDPAVSTADFLSAWWKVTSLMRLGYMVRVLTDDEMAYMAKLGAMTALRPYGRGAGNFILNRVEKQAIRGRNTMSHFEDMRRYWTARAGNLADQALRAAGRITEFDVQFRRAGRMLNAPSRPWMPKDRSMEMRRLGQESRDVTLESGRTVTTHGWAPRGAVGDYWRNLGSEDRLFMDSAEDVRLRAMREEWTKGLVQRGETNFYESWAHALNTQLGRDEMAAKLLAGESADDVVRWLKREPAGRAYARRLPLRARDPESWVHNIETFIGWYAPVPELRTLATTGKVTQKDLKKVPAALTPSQIHGPMLAFNQGKGAAAEVMDGFRRNFYKYMNQIPTDVLVRHPMSKALYEDRLEKLLNTFQRSGGQLTNQELRRIENQARRFSVNEVNKVVLDLSTHSNAAHVFRFIAPFYNAWDKALKRWGRLVYGKPEILFRGNQLWQGANNFPIAVDTFTNRGGAVVDSDGNVIYSRDKREFTGLSGASEQLLTFRMPEWMAKKLGVNNVFDMVQIPKSSLNLVLQGDPWWLPGFGPIVQIPVSEMVKDKPEYEEMMKTMLPYGPKSTKDLLLPTGLRKLDTWQNTENDDYSAAKINIWRTRYARWLESGRKGPPPDFRDPQIAKDAGRLHALRFFSQMVMPVNVRFTTPYKFYLDEYHKLMLPPDKGGVGPEKARDEFIRRYPDYFLFAESISQNNAGLPPTVEAFKASKRYKDLLALTPDIAPAVIGGAALGGDFNSAVYSQQFDQRLSPASSKTVREHRDLESFATEALANEGWRQFKRVSDLVRIVLSNRGLESTQQAGAEDLRAIKSLAVEVFRERYPAWYEEYSAFNPQKQESTIRQLTALANSQTLPRPRYAPGGDIFQLRTYLTVRRRFLDELTARKRAGGSGDIRAQSNDDLEEAWKYERDRLAIKNTVFTDVIYDRYLSNDEWLRA